MSVTVAALGCALSSAAAVLLARPGRARAPARRLHPQGGPGRAAAGGAPSGVASSGSSSSSARSQLTVPMVLELVAEVLASGASPTRAVAVVAECLERGGDPAATTLFRLAAGQPATPPPVASESSGAAGPLATALALAVATGAGPVTLIRAAAEEHRRRAQADQARAAQRLGVLVLLPTGLCLLPAFVLLTVVPLVIDLVVG